MSYKIYDPLTGIEGGVFLLDRTMNFSCKGHDGTIIIPKNHIIHLVVAKILHREDGPAIEPLDPNGSETLVGYLVDGFRHRENGPALVRVTPKYKIEKFYFKGLLHNIKGPAHTHKFFDEKKRHLNYAVEGKILCKTGWRLNPLVKKQTAADSIKKKLKRLLK